MYPQIGISGHDGRSQLSRGHGRVYERSRQPCVGCKRARSLLDISSALFRHAGDARELHLPRAAPGGGIPSEGEARAALAHPGNSSSLSPGLGC